jgi:hypothetical protein
MSSTALVGVPGHDAGVASAMVNTAQQVGGSLGVAFLNTIATTATAHYALHHGGPSPAAATHGFTTAFGYSAAVFALATVVVAVLVRARKDDITGAGADGTPVLETTAVDVEAIHAPVAI